MARAWDTHSVFKGFLGLSRWKVLPGIHSGICEKAARETVDSLEFDYVLCDNNNGKCVFKWETLYDNLKNGRYRPDDQAREELQLMILASHGLDDSDFPDFPDDPQ